MQMVEIAKKVAAALEKGGIVAYEPELDDNYVDIEVDDVEYRLWLQVPSYSYSEEQ
jgi:hypothetical protein